MALRRFLPRRTAAALTVMATIMVLAGLGLFFYFHRGAAPKAAFIPQD